MPHWREAGYRIWGASHTSDPDDFHRQGVPLEYLEGQALHSLETPDQVDAFVERLDQERLADPQLSLVVVAGAEPGVKIAAEINRRLGLGPADDWNLREEQTNKFLAQRRIEALRAEQKKEFEAVGLKAIPGVLSDRWSVLETWLQSQAPKRFIMKPPNSSGGHGQLVFDTRTENWKKMVQEHFESMIGQRSFSGGVIGEMLVEEFIDGQEYAVNTISVPGYHIVTDVLAYSRPIDERGQTRLDFDDFVDSEEPLVRDFLIPAASLVLQSLGKRQGPAHLEFRVRQSASGGVEVFLIEPNFRLCGAGLPPFGALNTGRDAALLSVLCYTNPNLIRAQSVDYQLRSSASAVFLYPQGKGDVLELDRTRELLSQLPSFYQAQWKNESSAVDGRLLLSKSSGDSDRSVVGSVWLRHADPDQIKQDREQIRLWEAEGQFEGHVSR